MSKHRTLRGPLVAASVVLLAGSLVVGGGSVAGAAVAPQKIATVAGTSSPGFSGDGGPATAAQLTQAFNVALASQRNVVFPDTQNHRVRVVAAQSGTFYGVAMTAGNIYTIAGTGTASSTGDGGPAVAATIDSPYSVAIDAFDNVLVGEILYVRVIAAASGTFYGQAMTAGNIYTIAGGGAGGDGGPATSAYINSPFLGLDTAGNVLMGDSQQSRVRVVAESNGTFYGQAMTAGSIYTIAGTGTGGFSGDGGAATAAEVFLPQGVTVDADANVVISDTVNNRIRVVAESTGTFYGQAMTVGNIYTIAGTGVDGFSGDGGAATGASLSSPQQLAVDPQGNIVFADPGNDRVRVIAVATGAPYGQPMTPGRIYTIAGGGPIGNLLNGAFYATEVFLDIPTGIAIDPSNGSVYVSTYGRVLVVGGGSPCAVGLFLAPVRLASASLGQSYSASVAGCGGTAPRKWKKVGKLPKGLKLNTKTGVISGTPKKATGTFTFAIQLRDKSKPKKVTSRSYSILVT